MIIEPVLAVPVLAVVVIVTDPFSVPLVGDKLTQSRLSGAVQAQVELKAVTNTELLPLLEVKLLLVGVIL